MILLISSVYVLLSVLTMDALMTVVYIIVNTDIAVSDLKEIRERFDAYEKMAITSLIQNPAKTFALGLVFWLYPWFAWGPLAMTKLIHASIIYHYWQWKNQN